MNQRTHETPLPDRQQHVDDIGKKLKAASEAVIDAHFVPLELREAIAEGLANAQALIEAHKTSTTIAIRLPEPAVV